MMADLWKPGAYHGSGKKKDYFEGWYIKSVDKDEKNAYAIIPGVSLSKDPSKSHAFVMLFDARNHRMYYFRYPLSEFRASSDTFDVRIGKSHFGLFGVSLDIDDGQNKVSGELRFNDIHPWPVTLLSPGVMGWYAFVPRMECYHGVLSFDHKIEGDISINGMAVDFSGGKGYIEKDWGVSMPSSWIWFQTNHFDEDGVSLFGSVAKIPWLGNYFTGYIFGLYYRKKLYPFTTYNGAKVNSLSVTEGRIAISVENNGYYLDIEADRAEGVDLPAPLLGEMTAKVNESLRASINVRLYKKTSNGRSPIFSGTGRNSGLEFVGNVEELLKGFKK
jgi:hypothetical protein